MPNHESMQQDKNRIKLLEQTTQNRLLRRTELEKVIGLSRSAIYSRLDPKSPHYDASFPRPIKMGTKTVAWLAAEIDGWVNSCILASRGV